MNPIKVLWADDEMELLKPHLLFLQQKGYEVIPVISGDEALEVLHQACECSSCIAVELSSLINTDLILD